MNNHLVLSVICILACSSFGSSSYRKTSKGYTYYPGRRSFKSVNFWSFGDQSLVTPEISETPSDIDMKIENVLETVRDSMSEGMPNLNVPPLDPLAVPDMTKDVKLTLYRGTVSVTDMSMTGLKTFQVNSIRFVMNEMAAVFNISVPSVKVDASYGADGRILVIKRLQLNGKTVVTVKNICVTGVIKLKISLFGASLDSYKINMRIGDYNIHLVNMSSFPLIDGIVDWFIKMVSSTFISHHQKQLTKLVDEKIEEVAKYVFENIDVNNILD